MVYKANSQTRFNTKLNLTCFLKPQYFRKNVVILSWNFWSFYPGSDTLP